MLRTALMAVGALALLAGACNTNYEDSEWYNDSGSMYYDMECNSSGCFFCDGPSCEEYRCDFSHQCPKGRVCGVGHSCLPESGSNPDVRYDPNDPDNPIPSDPTANPSDPVDPGSGRNCAAHADCPGGEICTLEGICVTSPGTPGNPPTGDPGSDPADPGSDPSDPGSDPSDPSDPADPGSDPSDPGSDPSDPTDPGSDPTDPTDPGAPIPLPDHPEDTCVVNDDCGLDGVCLDAGCYFQCAADNSCPPRQFCSEGQCLPLGGSENECTFNGECGPSMLCIEGTCYNGCAETLECGAHEMCQTGLCVADISPVIQCSGAGTCEAGEGCFDGKCLPSCAAASDCSDTQTCEYGYCHQNVYCLSSESCDTEHAGDVCLDGLCQGNPYPTTP